MILPCDRSPCKHRLCREIDTGASAFLGLLSLAESADTTLTQSRQYGHTPHRSAAACYLPTSIKVQKERSGVILSQSMARQAVRFGKVHFVIAMSAGSVFLVSLTLAWLGWRLLSQEEGLQKQQLHNRLEQRAEFLLRGFLRRLAEMDSLLTLIGPSLSTDDLARSQVGTGTMLVSFSKFGVEVLPRGLIY